MPDFTEADLRVLALRLEGIADRIATVPVQIEDANAVRQAALIVRAAVPFPKGVKVAASGDFDCLRAIDDEGHDGQH